MDDAADGSEDALFCGVVGVGLLHEEVVLVEEGGKFGSEGGPTRVAEEGDGAGGGDGETGGREGDEEEGENGGEVVGLALEEGGV